MRNLAFATLIAILGSVTSWIHNPVIPLAVVGDRPFSIAKTMAEVPLVLVPDNDIALYSNVHISSVSNTEPLVTCQLNRLTLDATPAVRLILKRPVLVDSPESLIQFPSSVSVVHEGLRMSIPIGALIAPIHGFIQGPQLVRIIYAIPTSPLSLRYPYYSPVPYPFRPSYEDLFDLKKPSAIHISTTSPPLTVKPITTPKPTIDLPSKPSIGVSGLQGILNNKKPTNRPLVTVLDFPTELASPASLYYQPLIEDELGNRGPPEAVIPAGIVQSTQPRPSLQLFLNAKESALLQSLRDEAEVYNKDKDNSNLNSIKVEAL